MTIPPEAIRARRKIFAEVLKKNGVTCCGLTTGSFRGGTSYICTMLSANGMPGLRGERFSKFWPLSRGGTEDEFRERLDAVFSSTRDGAFYSKIMWPHRNNLALAMGFGRGNSAGFAAMFPQAKWLNIIRRDKIGQAISLWKAKETNEWRFKGGETAPDPDYNYEALRKCYDEISAHALLWRDFHRKSKTDVLHINYEDFVGNEEERLPVLLDFFADHRDKSVEVAAKSPLKKQSNSHSKEIRKRFLDDLYKSPS